jgi:hypothetical protein
MRLRAGVCSMTAAMSLAVSARDVKAQTAMPNLSGNYRCDTFRQLCQPILGGGMGACLRQSHRRMPRGAPARQARR